MKKNTSNPQIIPMTQEYIPTDLENMGKVLSKLKGDFETKVVFFGTPEFVTPILEAIDKNFNLIAVVTGPDQIQGRKKILTPSPANLWTQQNAKQALVFTPEKLTEHLADALKNLEPDLFIVAAYGKIIPQSILDVPKFGALNVHPSLLPLFRGATPIQSALLAGVKLTGVTIIKMDAGMDHGPIVLQERFELSEQDTLEILHNKLFQYAAGILPGLIKDFIQGQVITKEQDHDAATFCKILKKEDAFFDLDSPPSPEMLDRMIRAYYPWPVAWTKWRVKGKVSRGKPAGGEEKVIKFYPGGMVQMEGKNKVSMKEFLNGYSNFPLKIFNR